ncbi:MAG: hypothetical protein ACLGH4_03835 [Actinomycetes bacterium]
MSTQTLRRAVRRTALTGFAIGFVMTFLGTFLALLLGVFEQLHPLIVPATLVLRPFAETTRDWNGLLTMVFAGIVNGVIYAAVFALAAAALSVVRRR